MHPLIIAATVTVQTAKTPAAGSRETIADAFAKTRAAGRIALIPFLPAGYPDLATTAAAIPALEAAGASLIEIGIPFSDPIADGPTIQEAFDFALTKNRTKVSEVFQTIASIRANVQIPLVAMLSYSIVFRYGIERFVANAKASGFDGLIIPDLPPPEAQKVCEVIRKGGLETILLVAPTTTAQRRKEIAQLSSGFVYYLSVSGITGERDKLPADIERNVNELRNLTDRPICVGFGIHKPEHLAQLRGLADGAIVGTAFVKRMKTQISDGPDDLAKAAGVYAKELLAGAGPQ